MKDFILTAAFFAFLFILILFFWRTNCPRCGQPLPGIRIPKSFAEALSGGWTCKNCGALVDRHGKEITEESKELKSQSIKRFIGLTISSLLIFFAIILLLKEKASPSLEPEKPIIPVSERNGALNAIAEGDLYIYPAVGGRNYLGKNGILIDLSPGDYVLQSRAPSTGEVCVEWKIFIAAGKTTLIKDNTYCR